MRSLYLLLLVASVFAADQPRVGSFSTIFTERHPESSYERMRIRYGWGDPNDGALYDIAKESFDVLVPSGYDGSTAYGLVVYTSPGKGGGAGGYAQVLAKHRLIWIGAANVENDRNSVPRWGLSLDAQWNMRKQYRIDPRRVYACGFSGGGRCASMVAPTYADLWSGAIYLCGCNSPVWPSEKLVGKPIRDLAMANRYALMTGSDDFNKPGTLSLFQSMQGMKFQHVDYFEQPGLGHAIPAPEWFEKGIVAVDQPLIVEATTLLSQAKGFEKSKPFEACRIYRRIIAEFPIASEVCAEAKGRFDAVAPAVDTMLRTEQAKLAGAAADKLRVFAAKAEGFSCAEDAKAQADAAGGVELDALLAKPGTTLPDRLAKFQIAWIGFACAVRAATAYDGLASAALVPVAALPAGKRAKPLAKLLKDWQECPSRTRTAVLLDEDLAAELEVILAIDKVATRGPKLVAFANAWPGTTAGTRAEEEAKKLMVPAKK